MSVMRCDSCEAMIDTDQHSEDIIVWAGPHGPCCVKCFEKLDSREAWNLALETVRHEMQYKPDFDLRAGVDTILSDLVL